MGQHQLAAVRRDEVVSDVARQTEALFSLPEGSTFYGDAMGNVVMARRLAWYVLCMRWRYSYPQLSQRWGYDQSSIRTGVLAICDELKISADLREKAKALGV